MNRLLHINKVYPSFDKPLWQVSEHIISIFLKKLINIFVCIKFYIYVCCGLQMKNTVQSASDMRMYELAITVQK